MLKIWLQNLVKTQDVIKKISIVDKSTKWTGGPLPMRNGNV
jgi:hypothetical protein